MLRIERLLVVAGIIGAFLLRGRSASQPAPDERGAAVRHARAVSEWNGRELGWRL
jgi:hypothetical protein